MNKTIVNFIGPDRTKHDTFNDFTLLTNSTLRNEDITVFQDTTILQYLDGNIVCNPFSKKIAMPKEAPQIGGNSLVYDTLKTEYHRFDSIATWNSELAHLPNYVFKIGGELTQLNVSPKPLPIHEFKLHNKSQLLNFITSDKVMCEGHLFRLSCLSYLQSNSASFDLFGRGFDPFSSKVDILKPYAFSIAIENANLINGISEKLLDCLLFGTIPIYYGCPNVGDFFDIRGILYFNTPEELLEIVNNLSMEKYQDMLPYVEKNLNIALDTYQTNDRIFHKFLK